MMTQIKNHTVSHPDLTKLRICIKGAGDLATGVAIRLHASGFSRILMLETHRPLAVRRAVSFSEAVYLKEKIVEGVLAKRISHSGQIEEAWRAGWIPVLVDPDWRTLKNGGFDVVVDAILAKRNLGTGRTEAPLVIGLGPGFNAGEDVHRVVETHRGHHLGRVIRQGRAIANTGVPGTIAGFGLERLLRAPADGVFITNLDIGHSVVAGQSVGRVTEEPVIARIGGVIRGLLRNGAQVTHGTKLGDIDPRNEVSACPFVSDKARAIGGGVLEAILEAFLGIRSPL